MITVICGPTPLLGISKQSIGLPRHCLDFLPLGQLIGIDRGWSYGPQITALCAESVLKQQRVWGKYFRLNLFQCKRLRLCQCGVTWTGLSYLSFHALELVRQRVDVFCNGIFLGLRMLAG